MPLTYLQTFSMLPWSVISNFRCLGFYWECRWWQRAKTCLWSKWREDEGCPSLQVIILLKYILMIHFFLSPRECLGCGARLRSNYSICSSSSSTSSDELWDTSRRTNSWHRKKAVSCHSPCWPRPGKHLLFTLKANLDIRCPMQSRPGLKMTTVCLNQHLNHQLQQPRLLFFLEFLT